MISNFKRLLTINQRSTAETCADMLEFTVSDVVLPGSLSELGNFENAFIETTGASSQNTC